MLFCAGFTRKRFYQTLFTSVEEVRSPIGFSSKIFLSIIKCATSLGADVTVDTTNAGGTAAGANITVSGQIDAAHALTLTAGTSGAVAFQAGSRSFNGSSDFIDVTSFNGFSSGNGMTLSAWVKPTVDSTQNVIINGGRTTSGGCFGGGEDCFFRLELTSSNKFSTVYGTGSNSGAWGGLTNNLDSTNAATSGTWYH